jgi:hypothetical protein
MALARESLAEAPRDAFETAFYHVVSVVTYHAYVNRRSQRFSHRTEEMLDEFGR